jgi:hypothetical protein
MWLVEHNRCWTTNRLAKRGTIAPARRFHQSLASCVFARQFWVALLRATGLQELVPQPNDVAFEDWWQLSSE